MKWLKNGLVHFHENDFVGDASWEAGLFSLRAGFDDQQELFLNVGQCWGLNREVQVLAAGLHYEQIVWAATEVRESRPIQKLGFVWIQKGAGYSLKNRLTDQN